VGWGGRGGVRVVGAGGEEDEVGEKGEEGSVVDVGE
jgi:hypothetical protein